MSATEGLQWLGNVHTSDVHFRTDTFTKQGIKVETGLPLHSDAFTAEQLSAQGFHGLYRVSVQCEEIEMKNRLSGTWECKNDATVKVNDSWFCKRHAKRHAGNNPNS